MQRRGGLTLVEVLVLIAILVFALGIGLPILQSRREAITRISCQSNLRNIGLALNNYCIGENVYPMSATGGPSGGPVHSWTTLILKEIDQFDLYDAYNFSVESYAPENRMIVGTNLRLLRCPDNPLPSLTSISSEKVRRIDGSFYPPGSEYAVGHYAANWGGGRLTGFGDDFARTQGNYRGLMMQVGIPTPRGVTTCIGPKDVVDGRATTILVGERRDGQGWAVGGYAGSEFDAAPSPLMPDRPDLRTVISGSFHPGGVNFAFADGSARYISGSINRKVWYALLTRDGGEAVSRDDY